MVKKRSVVLILSSIVLGLFLVVIAILDAAKIISLTPDPFPTTQEIASISIKDDADGVRIYLEDPEEISEIMSYLEDVHCFWGTHYEGGGIHYQLSFRDASGNRLFSVDFDDASYVVIDGYGYYSNISDLYQYISGLDWSQAEKL